MPSTRTLVIVASLLRGAFAADGGSCPGAPELYEGDEVSLLAHRAVQSKHRAADFGEPCDHEDLDLPAFCHTEFRRKRVHGYWVELTRDITIHSVRVADADGRGGPQAVQILRLNGAPPARPGTAKDYETLFYRRDVSGNDVISLPVPLHFAAGEVLGVLGSRGNSTHRQMVGGTSTSGITSSIGKLYRLMTRNTKLYMKPTTCGVSDDGGRQKGIALIETSISFGYDVHCFCSPKHSLVSPQALLTDYKVKEGHLVKLHKARPEPGAKECEERRVQGRKCQCCSATTAEFASLQKDFKISGGFIAPGCQTGLHLVECIKPSTTATTTGFSPWSEWST